MRQDFVRQPRVAAAVGFHDQSHLHRHVTRLVGTTPRRFATGA